MGISGKDLGFRFRTSVKSLHSHQLCSWPFSQAQLNIYSQDAPSLSCARPGKLWPRRVPNPVGPVDLEMVAPQISRNSQSVDVYPQEPRFNRNHVIWHRNLATPKRSVFRNCRAGFWFGFGSRSCRWYTFVWSTRNLLWESEKNHTWQFLVSLPACLYLQLRCPFLDTSPCLRAGCKLFFHYACFENRFRHAPKL